MIEGKAGTCATYHHEETVLATISTDFLAVGASAVRSPVCTGKVQGCHFDALIS